MPNKPVNEITEDEHYFRNYLNIEFSYDELMKLNERLPDDMKWVLMSEFKTQEHQHNKKISWGPKLYTNMGAMLKQQLITKGTFGYDKIDI